MTDRLNKILPRLISDDFLSGSGIGNEIAFYIFDYPPEDELRVREHIRFLLDHIPKQKPGLRVKHVNLFDFVLDHLKSRNSWTRPSRCSGRRATRRSRRPSPVRCTPRSWPRFRRGRPARRSTTWCSSPASAASTRCCGRSSLLSNLQPIMGSTPLVMFYPGKYDQMTLKLFGKLSLSATFEGAGKTRKSEHYYRAFRAGAVTEADMKIQNLFVRDIFRPINGVVKADQLDESSVWQELDEFVVTRELDQHFRKFFSAICDADQEPEDPDVAGKIGVWVSGFFGSGKSHFIKVLSYLLRNGTHSHEGQSKRAVEFFESKIKDAMLFGDIKRAVASHTDVILFNIDSKADHRSGRDAILRRLPQGPERDAGLLRRPPAHRPPGTLPRRQGQAPGSSTTPSRRPPAANGSTERDAYHFHRDEMVQALAERSGRARIRAEKWIDGAEEQLRPDRRELLQMDQGVPRLEGAGSPAVFLVDEVGQFIGTDTHLMLNLQTITEELGTICKGRAWVVVTSQEDIDAVLGEMKQSKANDFSKIQGRFKTRLSLSSANVDEVIQSRLLEKRDEVKDELAAVFEEKGDILKNQLTFKDCGMTLKNFKDGDDFVRNYPFAPYQFQLVQKVFEAIRRAGATGLHLSRGERSILDAFQSAAKQVASKDVGVLVPLYRSTRRSRASSTRRSRRPSTRPRTTPAWSTPSTSSCSRSSS